jgi:DNA mismatch repair protein MutS2
MKKSSGKKNRGRTRVIMRTLPHDISDELDLHGYKVEEALLQLDFYLDKAYLYGVSPLRIIHGHGLGLLRKAIRQHLQNHPLVKHFKPASQADGGDGVTLVYFNITPLNM